jgi:hypothetical protein
MEGFGRGADEARCWMRIPVRLHGWWTIDDRPREQGEESRGRREDGGARAQKRKKMSLTAAAAGSRWEAARVRDIGPNGPNRLGSVVFLFFFLISKHLLK